MQIIVYELNGKAIIVTPILESGLTIKEIAEKDAAANYFLIDDSELPDIKYRDRWIIQNKSVVIDMSVIVAKIPDWKTLYDRLLGGDLSSVFNRVNLAAIANPSITVGLLNMNGAITTVRVEQALASALQILKLSGYVFATQEIALWNTAIAELNFSNLVKL